MEFFIGWLVFSILAGVIASAKGRSGFGYFILSAILSPLVGIIAAIAMPAIRQTENTPAQAIIDSQRIPCPHCAELILPAANKCKHCGSDLIHQPPPPPPTAAEQQQTAMDKYGITKEGALYKYRDYRYENLQEAIAFAERMGGN